MNNNIVETIKERLDIVEFIRQYVPHLKRAGKTYKACCPFHKEKTPSFTCDSEKGLFYCFGCQAGGDIFEFLMKIENLTFNEAVKKLADMAGVEFQPLRPLTGEEQKRAAIRKLLDFAKTVYHKNLMSAGAENVRNYIKGRNLTKETCLKFQLGFAKNESTAFCRQAQASGYTEQQLKDAGLCALTQYGARDYYRGRLMFPIINQRNETVGFGGRILGDGEPKYLNSPETLVFSKSRVLYGLNFAGPAIRKAGFGVLLEGYMDVIGCHQGGVENTVAPLGTSLTPEHARLLKRYTDNVTVLFDPDSAGIRAALRGGLILIEQGLFVKVASLPDGLDPDEYIAQYGKEAFEKILTDAKDLIQFHLQVQTDLYEYPLSAQDKTRIITELVETISKQPDEIVRREWVKYVAEHIGVEEQLVLERLHRTEPAKTPFKFRQTQAEAQTVPNVNTAGEELLSHLLRLPLHVPQCDQLQQEDFENTTTWRVLQAIRQAYNENPAAENLTQTVIHNAPDLKQEVIRLSLLPVPKDFSAARDIEECVKKLSRSGVQKQLDAVKKQMKRLGTGNVPPELFKLYMQLQEKLKN